jgi:hypothetical protein
VREVDGAAERELDGDEEGVLLPRERLELPELERDGVELRLGVALRELDEPELGPATRLGVPELERALPLLRLELLGAADLLEPELRLGAGVLRLGAGVLRAVPEDPRELDPPEILDDPPDDLLLEPPEDPPRVTRWASTGKAISSTAAATATTPSTGLRIRILHS